MQLQVDFNECFVDFFFFFWHRQIGCMILLFKFKRLSLWGKKKKDRKHSQIVCNLLSGNLKHQVQKRDKQLSDF